MKKTNSQLFPAAVAAAFLIVSGEAFALLNPENQGRWNQPCTEGPDAEVPGFLVNMGPTGARGILKERSYVVKYIFAKSPAKDLLEIDDEVCGANGKKFSAHIFGGGYHGIEGPIQDLGLAIEDSEGSDGVLKLTVIRGGKTLEVSVQLEKLGRFSDTFPVDCAKTNILKERAYKFLIDNPGGIDVQGRCVATLAMLASDESKVFREGKRLALEWNKPYDSGTWSWHLGFQGIALAEYHLRTGDRSVLKTLKSSMTLLEEAQWKGDIQHWKSEQINGTDQTLLNKHQALYAGGFGHENYTEVVNRGGGGYGPMQWPTCLALMTWQLGKKCGLEAYAETVERSFQFLDHGTTEAGRVAYGGEFTLNNGPVNWEQWKASTENGGAHKSGLGHLVYLLFPERKESAKMMKLHLSNISAAYRDMPDGHACALMGLTWGWAGTYASGDKKLKKKVGDYYKAWINMARCHGSDSYVILPGRDYADHSYYRGNIRNHTTAAVAFLYSFSTPNLRLQGADGSEAGKANTGKLSEPSYGELRNYRNTDRTKSFKGRLVFFDPRVGLVRICLENGRMTDLEFLSLSKEDQGYVAEATAQLSAKRK
jgi:hypothetical protein